MKRGNGFEMNVLYSNRFFVNKVVTFFLLTSYVITNDMFYFLPINT